jgi:hypothetical protein
MKGERDGFYWLGVLLKELDPVRSKKSLEKAGSLGHHWSFVHLAAFYDENSVEHFLCLEQAIVFSGIKIAAAASNEKVTANPKVLFVLGRCLKGQINLENRFIFHPAHSPTFDLHVKGALQAVAFYEAQIHAAKAAVKTWSLCGIRMKIMKDMRVLIAKIVWEARQDANYAKK